MDVNALASGMGDATYGLLAINFMWGLYCAVLLWRTTVKLSFGSQLLQDQFLEELRTCMEKKDLGAAAEICRHEERAIPRLAMAVFANRNLSYAQLRQLIGEMMHRDIVSDLEHRLNWIATVIKSGPLLGLFGTVLGMMAAFGRIGTGEKVQPSQIAHEISIALICTAMGLLTAIPFTYVLATLNIRVRTIQDSVVSGIGRFLEQYGAAMGKTGP